jgi:hypothetical protein
MGNDKHMRSISAIFGGKELKYSRLTNAASKVVF